MLVSNEIIFTSKSIILTSILLIEIIRIKKITLENWYLHPTILALFYTFILGFGITNLIYILPNSFYYNTIFYRFGPNPYELLNKTINYALIASCGMLIGYRLNIGNTIFNAMSRFLNLKRYLKKSYKIKFGNFLFFYIISLSAKLYAIQIGIYGFSSTSEALAAASGQAQIIYYLSGIGKLLLLVISLAYYSGQSEFKLKILFYLVLVTELIFGFLSGSKGPIVLVFLIPLLSYIYFYKKLNRTLVISVVISLIIAYAIIEPFRMLRKQDLGFQSDVNYISTTMIDAYSMNQSRELADVSTIETMTFRILARQNYILDAAKAIEYDETFTLSAHDPDFRMRLLTFPMQAFIPRAIWSSKPEENIGGWFAQKVWGFPPGTSIAMTPIGFLNFAGGITLIFLIFMLIGIAQKSFWNLIDYNSGGVLLFFTLLWSVVYIDSTVNTIPVGWLRDIPLIIIFQRFIFVK